jgi:hypothetical protein
VVALSTSSTAATYKVEGATASVTLTATGHCWAQIREGTESGPVIFQGTLPRSWEGTGSLWIRLGDPSAVAIEVDGETMHPPVVPGTPFDLQIS